MKPETQAQMVLRETRNFIERQCRMYPGLRSRANCRERLRKIHGWDAKVAAAKSTLNPQTP